MTAEATATPPTEDVSVYVYVLIAGLITAVAIVILPRPGPAPGCRDAELLTIAAARHRRVPAGDQDRPGQPHHPGLEYRARRRERSAS